MARREAAGGGGGVTEIHVGDISVLFGGPNNSYRRETFPRATTTEDLLGEAWLPLPSRAQVHSLAGARPRVEFVRVAAFHKS